MPGDYALVTDLLGRRIEAETRPGWNPPPRAVAAGEIRGSYSIDSRQTDNDPLTGIVRSIAVRRDFVFHIEADDGRLVVKTSTASCLRVVR